MTRDELRMAKFVSECRIVCDHCHDSGKVATHVIDATNISTLHNLRLCYDCYCLIVTLSDQTTLEKVGLR